MNIFGKKPAPSENRMQIDPWELYNGPGDTPARKEWNRKQKRERFQKCLARVGIGTAVAGELVVVVTESETLGNAGAIAIVGGSICFLAGKLRPDLLPFPKISEASLEIPQVTEVMPTAHTAEPV